MTNRINFRKKKNALLVFPPCLSPSCIPLGIASLKSYIENYLPAVNITLLDLNISFVDRALNGEMSNMETICTDNNIACSSKNKSCPFAAKMPEIQKKIFKKAREIIRDRNLFFNKKLFEKYIGDSYIYVRRINNCLSRKILSEYAEGRVKNSETISKLFEKELNSIKSSEPDVVGFSVWVEAQLPYALTLARQVKSKMDIPVIFGGPALYHFNQREFMEAFGVVNFIISQEGEKGMLELLKNIFNKKNDYEKIPNLVWRAGKNIVINESSIIKNPDMLPTPNFDGLPLDRYYFPETILPLSASRGCPWGKCRFCQLNAQYGEGYRQRAIGRVVSDIKTLNKKYGVSNFFFADSEIPAGRLKKLSTALVESGIKIHFGCYARPGISLTPDIIKTVHRGGGRFIQLGVESLSEGCLKIINKGTTPGSIRSVIASARKYKINLLTYMMTGLPHQTRKEFLADIRGISHLQEKYNIFSVRYSVYGMGPDQPFYREANNNGIIIRQRGPYFVTADGKSVHKYDWPVFYYKNGKGAYDILSSSKNGEKINSPVIALEKLNLLCHRYGLNGRHLIFISIINDFLFETQLLYSKRIKTPCRKKRDIKKYHRFYNRNEKKIKL